MSFRGSPPVHSAPASQPLASSCSRNLHCPPCSKSTAISHNGVSSAVSQANVVQRMSFRGSPPVHSAPASQPLASGCRRNLHCPPCSTSTSISHNSLLCPAVSQANVVQRMSFRDSPPVHSAPASQLRQWLPAKLRNLYYRPCSMSTALCNPPLDIRCQSRSVSPA
ncbi:uncharacterized protein [Dermacentor andersoni]